MNNTQTIVDTNDPQDLGLIDKLKSIGALSQVLRLLGAGSILVALSLFLLEGWTEGNDLYRYMKLLAMTGLMTLGGIGLSALLKEYKGARIFFGLSLISAVANFTILGALIYSIFPLDGLLGNYPQQATWQLADSGGFWLIFAGATLLLGALARFSYSIFARKSAPLLTTAFLGLNALLLIPARSSIAASIMILGAVGLAIYITKRIVAEKDAVITAEVKFALATLFLPGLIIAGRALGLYQVNELVLLTISSVAYMLLRTVAAQLNPKQLRYKLIASSLLVGSFFIAYLSTELIPASVSGLAPIAFSAIVFTLCADQLVRARDIVWKAIILNLSSLILLASIVLLALVSHDLADKVSAVVVSLGAYGFAFFAKQHIADKSDSARLLASLAVIASVLLLAAKFIAVVQLSNWVLFSLGGAGLILAASLYERFGLKFASKKNA